MKNFFKYSFLGLVLLSACTKPIEPAVEAVLNIDKTSIEFAAAKAQDQVVKLESNVEWTAATEAKWITVDPSQGKGNAEVKISVSENLPEGEEAVDPRSAKVVFTADKHSLELTVNQQGVNAKGIASAQDYLDFVKAANAGESLEKFCNSAGEVILLCDIDMDGQEVGCVRNFSGVFNGMNRCISNICINVTLEDAESFGLFGTLDGATVKDLVLGKEGDKSSFVVAAKAAANAGVLAGAVRNGSVIDNCVNNVPFEIKGTSTDEKRLAAGCFAGTVNSGDNAVSMSKLVNNASIVADAGKNTKNGATGVMVGGIVGFCDGSGTATVIIENCENKGDITARCGRSSGIAASMNAKTMMRYCVNRGNQTNTFVNARVANLTCIMGSGCVMDDCTNYGNVITSDAQTTTAAMVALLNNDNVVVTGGGNYGEIIGANDKYHGLLIANFSKFSSVKGCFAGGSCGAYSADGKHVMHTLDKDSWYAHIGYCSDANKAKITEISSPWGTGGAPANPENPNLPELKDASLRILFIGNSFTKDAIEHLPGLIAAAGLKDITLAHCYYGGRTIPEYYADREVANNTLYYANPGASSWSTAPQEASVSAVAKSGRWDIVTIQEHTGNYRAWSWTADEKNAINSLIEFVSSTQSAKPKVGYVMSQAYYNMAKIATASKPYVTWSTQAEMYDIIVAQVKKIMAECPVDEVLATGTMLQNLRTSKLDNEMNLTRDGYHMDYGISRYGAACLMFEKLVAPKFNVSLENNSYRYSNSSTSDSGYSTPVTDKNALFAQKAAHLAVLTPFAVTSMAGEGPDEPSAPDVPEFSLSGSGTQADPYLIQKGEDMRQIAQTLAEGQTRYFKMTSDIDMSSITDWAPVNTDNVAKNIDFDGCNHTISGFSCNNTDAKYGSLFGLISGSVRNLSINGASVSNKGQCGILATWLGNNGASATNVLKATVENVHISNAILKMVGTGASAVGMIASNAGSSTIRDCSATGKIEHNYKGGKWVYVGGLVGRSYLQCQYERCSFIGEIVSAGAFGFGGITAGTGKDNALVITDCYTAGSIANASYSGGVVAELCTGSTVQNSYSTMALEGAYNLGGIVARASNASNPKSTGTFSTDLNITVKNCIAWNPSIKSTNAANETPATHYSSGAVVGFTTYLNKLSGCVRRSDMDFLAYNIEAYNSLVDTPDVSPTAPLVKPGTEDFLCPYNGSSSALTTVSAIAKTLGWSESVWDLSGDFPILK